MCLLPHSFSSFYFLYSEAHLSRHYPLFLPQVSLSIICLSLRVSTSLHFCLISFHESFSFFNNKRSQAKSSWSLPYQSGHVPSPSLLWEGISLKNRSSHITYPAPTPLSSPPSIALFSCNSRLCASNCQTHGPGFSYNSWPVHCLWRYWSLHLETLPTCFLSHASPDFFPIAQLLCIRVLRRRLFSSQTSAPLKVHPSTLSAHLLLDSVTTYSCRFLSLQLRLWTLLIPVPGILNSVSSKLYFYSQPTPSVFSASINEAIWSILKSRSCFLFLYSYFLFPYSSLMTQPCKNYLLTPLILPSPLQAITSTTTLVQALITLSRVTAVAL